MSSPTPLGHPGDFTNALHAEADFVCEELHQQRHLWDKGFTRRSFLAGAGMVAAAALGSQLITSKVSYAAADDPTTLNTLVVVFLRGAADGLRVLVPASSALGLDYLKTVRPSLVPAAADLRPIAASPGWALNKGFDPLLPYLTTNELAFVPAVSAAGVTRSHFQAQSFLEAGGLAGATTGWLDRMLQTMGPGTTFRALSEGTAQPASLAGDAPVVTMNSLAGFSFPGWAPMAAASQKAISDLYRGLDSTLAEDIPTTIAALSTAAAASAGAAPQNGAVYPTDQFGKAMADLATLLRAEAGVQVATVDVGGWDTHTAEANNLDSQIAAAAKTLAAFLQDLGPLRRSRVTVAVMTEFGRRVGQNANAGTDHGHGSVMWLLGGGLQRAGVVGSWTAPSATTLDDGDVPGTNQAFDVLGELAQKRLGIGSLATIFPGHSFAPLGLARAANATVRAAAPMPRGQQPQRWTSGAPQLPAAQH